MRTTLGTSVGERGQITIKREIRESLGVRPKDIAIQAIVDGRLVVTFVRPHAPHMRSVAGTLGPPPRVPDVDFDFDAAAALGAAEDYVAGSPRDGVRAADG